MKDFFIWCSGASVKLVNKSGSEEQTKYVTIGIAVFAVACLAVISSTFFLSFAFNTDEVTFNWHLLPIGILWGFIIISLDRTIVSTISKADIWYIQALKSIPRIILALVIGVIISTPIEFVIFGKEINEKIDIEAEKFLAQEIENNKVAITAEFQPKIESLEEQVKNLKLEYDEYHQMYVDEVEGRKSGFPGKGKRANEYMTLELNSHKKYMSKIAELDSLTSLRDNAIGNYLSTIDRDKVLTEYKKENVGVLKRTGILYKLGPLHLAITILFILIEVIPLLTKLLSNKGRYDDLVLEESDHNRELEKINKHKKIQLEEKRLDLQNESQIKRENYRLYLEKELQKQILLEISKAQNEIALKRIETFRMQNLTDLNIPDDQHPNARTEFVEIFWKLDDPNSITEYCFRNGKSKDNKFLMFCDDTIKSGIWNYNQTQTKLKINLSDEVMTLEIIEIRSDSLRLKDESNSKILEFKSCIHELEIPKI